MTVENTDYRPSGKFGPLTGRRVLAGFIFFFGIVFAVNTLMVWRALSTFDGVEVEGAYQKGRAYNHLLEQMETQKALGWKSTIETELLAGEGYETLLHIRFETVDGAPLQGLAVEGEFWRPVTQGEDKKAMLTETAPGLYTAHFNLTHAGNWLVRIAAEGPKGETFVEEQRVILRDKDRLRDKDGK